MNIQTFNNVAEEIDAQALIAFGNEMTARIHAALDRNSCPECGGWDGMHDVTVVLPFMDEHDREGVTFYVNPTGYPGSVFVTCPVCNRAGTIPDGFTVREVA